MKPTKKEADLLWGSLWLVYCMVFLEPPDVLLEGSDQKEAEIRNNAVASF